VFDDKTIAAFETVKDKLSYHPGTVKLITLITNWFKMINVKNRYDDIRLMDVKRAVCVPRGRMIAIVSRSWSPYAML